MKQTTTTLMLLTAFLFAVGCQHTPASAPHAAAQPKTQYTLEQCMPNLANHEIASQGRAIVEVFWPNGNVRYSAIYKDGEPLRIECFTPEQKIIYVMAREDDPIPTGRTLSEIASVLTSSTGTDSEQEQYFHDGFATLQLKAEFATLPNAVYIADTLNGVLRMSPNKPLVAQIIDRSTIRLRLPDYAHEGNDRFSFLAMALRTHIDADAALRYDALDTNQD